MLLGVRIIGFTMVCCARHHSGASGGSMWIVGLTSVGSVVLCSVEIIVCGFLTPACKISDTGGQQGTMEPKTRRLQGLQPPGLSTSG